MKIIIALFQCSFCYYCCYFLVFTFFLIPLRSSYISVLSIWSLPIKCICEPGPSSNVHFRGAAECNSYASFVLSKLPACSISRHLQQESPKGDFYLSCKGAIFSEGRGRLYTLRLLQNLVADHCMRASHVRLKHKLIQNIVPF